MKSTTKQLREGETAVCDCCGSELTARVVVTDTGNFGTDCWKSIKTVASYLKNAIRFPAAYEGTAEAAVAKVEAKYGAKAAWIKAVAA
jgi:hypothetical protein